jgi:hypothetical protein
MGRRRYAMHSFSFPFVGIEELYTKISSLIHQEQYPTLQGSRLKTLNLHWKIGRLIVEYENQWMASDEDHQELLCQLPGQIVKKFGELFSFSTLEKSCKFYLAYLPFSKKDNSSESADISQFQVSLTWDHYRLLVDVSCPKARNFYENEASNSNWSPLLLEQFIKSHVFERLLNSTNKESVLRSVQQGSLELFSANNNDLGKLMD